MVLILMIVGFAVRPTEAQIGVYGALSRGSLSSSSSQDGVQTLLAPGISAWGGTFGVYDNRYHLGPLRFGGDARFFIESGKNNSYGNQIRGLLVGPRLAFRAPAVPFSPYIQLEAGLGSTNYGVNASRSTSFTYQINGGLDYAIIPRLDARFEYGTGRIGPLYSGSHQTMDQILLGLVLRF